MTEAMKQTLLDLKTRQQAGEHMLCPRCGMDAMDPEVRTNAISRHADIFVCNDCGVSEAMLDFMRNPLPLHQWAFFQEGRPISNFKTMPAPLVWERLQKQQLPYLTDLYKRWLDVEGKEDFEAYRAEAYLHCPGLTHLWLQPFQAVYNVFEGQLLLRFRKMGDDVEIAHDLIQL